MSRKLKIDLLAERDEARRQLELLQRQLEGELENNRRLTSELGEAERQLQLADEATKYLQRRVEDEHQRLLKVEVERDTLRGQLDRLFAKLLDRISK